MAFEHSIERMNISFRRAEHFSDAALFKSMTDVHEYVSISCPTTNAKELLQQFLAELPEEFFCVTEKEADSQLKSHMISLLGSEELFEELQKDCE